MAVGGCLEIQYTGASASCLLKGNATAKTLTSLIGVAGAEVADAAFGTAGVLDLTGTTVDTLEELAAVINAYADYTAAVTYGDDIDTENILTATVQAKGVKGYVLFNLATSVLATYALTTWARYKALRGASLAPDSDQTQVEYMINAATEQGEMIACRRLAARDYGVARESPYDFDGNGRDKMLLPNFPINSVAHLYIDDTRVFGAGTEIDSDDFTWYSDEGILAYPFLTFPVGMRNVRVEYNAGYSTIPDRVQLAVIEIVAWNLSRMRGSSIGMRTVSSSDGVASSYEIEIPTSARRVFESLKSRAL
jgi:hypothetical protein